jgi:hypothetical protein
MDSDQLFHVRQLFYQGKLLLFSRSMFGWETTDLNVDAFSSQATTPPVRPAPKLPLLTHDHP